MNTFRRIDDEKNRSSPGCGNVGLDLRGRGDPGQVLESGDASGFLTFLRSGGSRYPIETLASAGVDMGGPAPVQAALDLFARRVGELRELLG